MNTPASADEADKLDLLDQIIRRYSSTFAAKNGLSTDAVVLVLIVAAHSLALVHYDNDKSAAIQMLSDAINTSSKHRA